MASRKIIIDGVKPTCGLCIKNQTMDVLGFFAQTGVQIIDNKLMVFPSSVGANTIYTQEVPIKFCPFCGRKLQEIPIFLDGRRFNIGVD